MQSIRRRHRPGASLSGDPRGFALLTLPAAWRGLQPIDGWLWRIGVSRLSGTGPLRRARGEGEEVEWKRERRRWLAAAGVGALGVGPISPFSHRKIVSSLGISNIVGGLFITAAVASLPEVFTTWDVTRTGQVTSAGTSVLRDHVVTMTLAFIPLTIIGMPIENLQLFWVTLTFVAIMPALYAAFIWWGGRESGFSRWQVFMLPIVYAAFVAAIVFWVQPFGQDAQVGSGGGQRSGQQQEQIGQLFAHFGPEAGACVG